MDTHDRCPRCFAPTTSLPCTACGWRPGQDNEPPALPLGLVLRDIAPDNIYLSRGGRVILLDFGAARQAVRDKSQALSAIFKPGYVPWEQCLSGGRQGPWTDVYGVAATLYRATTGQTPPEAPDRIDEDTLVPPSALGVAIPPVAEAALMHALAVRPTERTQDIAILQQGLRGEEPPPPPPKPRKPEPPRLPERVPPKPPARSRPGRNRRARPRSASPSSRRRS